MRISHGTASPPTPPGTACICAVPHIYAYRTHERLGKVAAGRGNLLNSKQAVSTHLVLFQPPNFGLKLGNPLLFTPNNGPRHDLRDEVDH